MAAGTGPEQWSFTGYGAFLGISVPVPQGRPRGWRVERGGVTLRVPGWEGCSTGLQKKLLCKKRDLLVCKKTLKKPKKLFAKKRSFDVQKNLLAKKEIFLFEKKKTFLQKKGSFGLQKRPFCKKRDLSV